MESTSQNSQLNNVLNNVLGLDEDDSLLSQNDEHHEDSDDAYDGPEHYLHSDDEDVINTLFEEMNQPEYVSFACDKSRKPTAKNYSKRVDCKYKVNCVVLPDGSCRVTTVTTEHNHELQPSLARLFGCHRKISKALKRNLEAHDIAGIRPAKSIRLLKLQAGGPDRMGCTPKDC
ncbi:hypothetical protein H5410_016834 [Solanum commersonii]|uniref:Protein FAR1-RELATED SEQUENCE n=1 Tax=Solanum commersonii TaxID=4109 RepID=A0A9J5ZYD9_SOLCO|nr:hypothetical protein H5410_016834 [Solanum commersonii]